MFACLGLHGDQGLGEALGLPLPHDARPVRAQPQGRGRVVGGQLRHVRPQAVEVAALDGARGVVLPGRGPLVAARQALGPQEVREQRVQCAAVDVVREVAPQHQLAEDVPENTRGGRAWREGAGVRSGKFQSGCRAAAGDVKRLGGGYWRLEMRWLGRRGMGIPLGSSQGRSVGGEGVIPPSLKRFPARGGGGHGWGGI